MKNRDAQRCAPGAGDGGAAGRGFGVSNTPEGRFFWVGHTEMGSTMLM